jgi:hypothetical protein
MKNVYIITITEQSSRYMYVEAETAEEARVYAHNLQDSHGWRENQDNQVMAQEVELVNNPKEKLRGKYVERTDGTSDYAENL